MMKSPRYAGVLCDNADRKPEKKDGAPEKGARLCYAAFLLFLGALLLCLLLSRGQAREQPAFSARAEGVRVTFVQPVLDGFTTATRRELLLGTLLLVSPSHPLPEDYPGGNARGFKALVGEYIPAKEALTLRAEALYALCDIRLERPLEDVMLTVGAVSYEEQTALRRAAFAEYLKIYDPEEALRLTELIAPKAGCSEHQTGLCLDITLRGTQSYQHDDPMLRTATGAWLSGNLWRFGFIRRFAPGQNDQGGCGGLHIRYVGRPHAAAMRALQLNLEEYLSLLQGGQALLIDINGEETLVYAVPDDGGTRFPAPKGARCAVSLDNLGFVILSAKLP